MNDNEIVLLKNLALCAVYMGCIETIKKQSRNTKPEFRSAYNIKKTIEYDYWDFENNLTKLARKCVSVIENMEKMEVKEWMEYKNLLSIIHR